MGVELNLGFNKSNTQDFIDHTMLGLMMKSIIAYERLPANKKGLNDANEYWYRMALMNLATKFSPWALQNHYKKYLSEWNTVKAIRDWTGAKQNDRSYGNDRPYTISEAENLYGGGWVKYTDQWKNAGTFGQGFKPAVKVIGGALMGAAGGPAGIILGAVAGGASYVAEEKAKAAQKAELNGELNKAIQLNAEAKAAEKTVLASVGLVELNGPKLWALGILIVFVVVLFYSKKKP